MTPTPAPRVPFVIGQWVRGERFYGRERLISEILEGPRNGLWLLGTRRIGKTSLLKQLEHLCTTSPQRGFFPLFWDFQGADDPAELHAGFADALLDAEERLEQIDVDLETVAADDLFTAMSRLRRRLHTKGLRLLLLCDEVEELIELHEKEPALLGKLRHAMQASEDVRSVLASTIRLWALADQRGDTSPFLHGFTPPLFIRAMTDEAAEALVQQSHLPAEMRPALADEEVEAIRRRCDNHPYLLQLIGKRRLETGELEQAIEEVGNDQMVAYFFSVDFEMLSPAEQRILLTVARDTPAASDTLEGRLALDPAALGSSLQSLENLGYIHRDADRKVVLANHFFRRWLADLEPAGGAGLQPTAPMAGDPDARTARRTAAGSLLDGRYELRRKAGEGATGSVYEAWDRLLQTRIAVKLLRREYAGNSLVLERFRQEILLSRNLGHPNILRAYHLGQFEGRAYLTMQWIDGPTLATTIAEEAPLPEERVAFLGVRLASALAAAHAHNVLHRDIKPHNILLEASGEPLITDFGLARLLEGPGVTTAGVFLGTPNYVSPEQSRLEPLDGRSDLYSLGVVLFEMATGRCPFRGETAAEVLEMHRSLAPPDPREMAAEISAELARTILSCLEKDPERRLAGAEELRRSLEALLPGGRAAEHTGAVVSRIEADETPVRAKPEDSPGPAARDRRASADELLPLVYDELRGLARGFLSRERPNHTLQPTALVHEAYLRLANQQAVDWAGRTHFFAVGARVMRRLLIDHARSRGRRKRGGDFRKVTLQEAVTPSAGRNLGLDELLTLDAALEELAARNERQAVIVELRFFGGLTVAETAEHLGLSKRTIEADWTAAREWLRLRLEAPEGAA